MKKGVKAPRHTVRILPLGDSLTQGDGNPSAYRYDLFRLLSEADIPFTFVGGCVSADFRMPREFRRHSGRGGITTQGLVSYHTEGDALYQPAWCQAVREADVVLLYIGTNDTHRGLPPEEFITRLCCLLDLLYSYREGLVVYVATLRSKGALGEGARLINAAILGEELSAYARAHGREIHTVDFNGRGTPKNLPSDYPEDDGHPAADGNRKLAEMWFGAIARRVSELADTLPPDNDSAPLPLALSTNLSDMTIAPGRSCSIRSAVMPGTVRIPSVAYSSSDAAVARVDEYGRVTGVSHGTCKITVRAIAGGFTRSATVTVAGDAYEPLAGHRILLSGAPTSDSFTGEDACFIERPRAIRIRYPQWTGGSIESREAFSAAEGFCLSFRMRFCTHTELPAESRLSISFGGVTLTFAAGDTAITLGAAGAAPRVYHQSTPTYLIARYDLILRDGTATLLRDGEALLSVGASPCRTATPIKLTWHETFGTRYFEDISLGIPEK